MGTSKISTENMNLKLSPAKLKVHLLSEGMFFEWSLFSEIKRNFYKNQFGYNQTSKGIKKSYCLPQLLCLENKVITALLRREGSPWNLRRGEDNVLLYYHDDFVTALSLPEVPPYFGKRLSDGTLSENVIAVAGEQTPGFLFYPLCAYFDRGAPCKFCSVKSTRATLGKELVSNFTDQQIIEATKLFQGTPWRDIPIVAITTGTFPECDAGAEYVSQKIKLIYDALNPKIPIHVLTMPPENLDLIEKYKEAGATTLAFNLEVFDRDIFTNICPGKEKYYGYNKFLKAFDKAKEVFGSYKVFCGFIWGLEPVNSTIAGYQYFLDRGISISSNVFHSDARSAFSNKAHPSVETILDLCESQSRLYQKYPEARTIYPGSMRSTLDFEVYRGDFK